MLKQLSEQDASFLYLETTETPQHVGGMSLVELPPGYQGNFYEDYKAHIARRLHLIPMLYRKLLPLPFDIDHPFWAEEENVDVDYHIRHLTLPKPGRFSQLEELIGRLHSNFLDRSRPLWEFYVIDGLDSGHVAIYTKIHHAAMDGAASQVLISTMYDPTPVPRQLPPRPPKSATPGSEQLDGFLGGVLTHVVRQELRAIQYIPEALKAWANLALPNAQTLKYDQKLTPPPPTPRSLFNVGITSQRAYAARSLPLSAFKRIAKQTESKVNDVVLTVCSSALRRYLQARDALPQQSMTAMVPVSLHEAGDQEFENKNHVMICTLASDIADPYRRLMAIRKSSSDQKKLVNNVRNALLPDLSVLGGGTLVRGMMELYRRAKLADKLPPLANLTISNVPGPPVPLYIVGAKLLTFYPCSIPFHSSAVNITAESYCDSLDFGLIACRRTVPDVDELANYLAPALEELQRAVAARLAPPAAKPAKAQAAKPAAKRAGTRKAGATRPVASTPAPRARKAAPVARPVGIPAKEPAEVPAVAPASAPRSVARPTLVAAPAAVVVLPPPAPPPAPAPTVAHAPVAAAPLPEVAAVPVAAAQAIPEPTLATK